MGKFFIQIKREFWECRASLILTPFVMAGILMVLLLIGLVPFQAKIAAFMDSSHTEFQVGGEQGEKFLEEWKGEMPLGADPAYLIHGLAGVYSLFILVLLLVLTFYFVDALYSDRRDQSILFWKSLPVAEHSTILAKLVAGIAGAPLFYAAAALATGAFYLLVLSLYAKVFWSLPVPGLGAVLVSLFSSLIGLVLGWWLLVLWFLPLFSWLLFSSAVARKAPFLIAVGAPLGIIIFEALVFGTRHSLNVLKDQLIAGLYHLQLLVHQPGSIVESLSNSFLSAQLWLGLIVSASFLLACAWLRRNRWEI